MRCAFLLVLAAFAASAVEMVEALTIVLAVGVAAGGQPSPASPWRAALTVIIAVLGPALDQLPIDALRVVVGTCC